MNTYYLNNLKVGRSAQILRVDESELKQRFLDLGIVPGAYVQCVGKSPHGDMKAYIIKGAVIAIRSSDSETVLVSEGKDMLWD